MVPHDLETFRHQMSTYLSNALTNNVPGTNSNSDRSSLAVPPPHYLPFLMNHLDDKVLTRLPSSTGNHPPNLALLYHPHPGQSGTLNISSASPTSSSSNSSTSDIHEQTSSYLNNFDHHHRRNKLEIQDTTA